MPRLTLWVWERPESLTEIDPQTAGVAVLDQTISIDGYGGVKSRPRLSPVRLAAGTRRIAVVRIEAAARSNLREETRDAVVRLLLQSARTPGISAFQVDFDATRSQREFYRTLLRDLRKEMRSDLPLSMTALASWCSWDDWIGDLPVDEAVPMFFRMEPDRRSGVAFRSEYRVREPLCLGSVGLSTHERAVGDDDAGKRVYLFPDLGWQRDRLATAARTGFWRLH